MNNQVQLPVSEIVTLAAADDDFYCQHFFPRTFRQKMPGFSAQMNAVLNDPSKRYVGFKMFRGSSKTTRIRARVSKHIAYGLSRVILFVSNAQKHSIYSLKWLKKQVEYNTQWAQTFDLRKGSTWTEECIEIFHGVEQVPITVLALGITGQIRGINIDDYRPDLIVLDDPDSEETTATPEQREKTSDLVFGALAKSLAPPSEAPQAKMILAQTPFNKFDLVTKCEEDAAWHILTLGCFDTRGGSVWPERFSTEFLLAEKAQHVRTNKLSLWMREMECRIVAKELASFRDDWLQYWDVLPDDLQYIIAIDPASSDSKDADDQVIGVLGWRWVSRKLHVYLVAYTAEKGEMPEAAAVTFFHYKRTYRPRKAAVESVSYQRVLAWYLESKMREQGTWLVVEQVQDKRRKADRIEQEIGSVASDFRLWVRSEHTQFIEQFTTYSPLVKMHDDVLDMLAIGIRSIKGYGGYALDGEFEEVIEQERDIPALPEWRSAP